MICMPVKQILEFCSKNLSSQIQVITLTELIPILFGGKDIIIVQESKKYTLEIFLHSINDVPKDYQFYHTVKEKICK